MDNQALLSKYLNQEMTKIQRKMNLNRDKEESERFNGNNGEYSEVETPAPVSTVAGVGNGDATSELGEDTTQPKNDSESKGDNEKNFDAICSRNNSRVIAPENHRKREFAKVGKKIILKNTRLERWLNCWLEYLRDVYKAASSDEKPIIETVGKLWQGVLNEDSGVYNATIPTNKFLNLLDYCDLEFASNVELEDEVMYRRDFLILATKAVIEGIIKKYPAVFNRILDQQLLPLNIATEMIQDAARLNRWENFEVEEILKFMGGVIYADESGVEYVLTYDVILMVDILRGEDGAVFD